MMWFTNLSTRAKLLYSFSGMWVLLAIVIVTSYLGITRITRSENELRDHYIEEALQLIQLRANQNYSRGLILEMILTGDKGKQQALTDSLEERRSQNDEIIAKLKGLDQDSENLRRLAELENLLNAYHQTREQQVALIREGRLEEAQQLAISLQEERFVKIRLTVKDLGEKSRDGLNRRIEADMGAARTIIVIFIIIGIVSVLLGSLLIMVLNTIMAKPLVRLTNVAESIAAGNLNIAPELEGRKDEVGRLTDSFVRMTRSLRDLAHLAGQIAAGDLSVAVKPQSDKDVLGNAFAGMAENLRRSITEISDAVNVLGSSSNEILAATTQVATSTSETAAAIGETTTTVEEVRQAAQLSSQKAQNVSDSAKRVAQVSQTGQQAVEETAAGMGRIRDQMESIARTIVRLSEQGQFIGSIIATVTDLADQSNLLAVNAAIEAARAGEYGRGFTVVANEIERLAEQSKQATAQVREILNDLQKATGAAVMATEQGSKAVEAGVTQSALAGASIKALAETSEEAAQMAMQIAASSQQQLVGMNQIGVAMENINQAGSETVTGMKQSEEAARNLRDLGRNLKQLISHYKV